MAPFAHLNCTVCSPQWCCLLTPMVCLFTSMLLFAHLNGTVCSPQLHCLLTSMVLFVHLNVAVCSPQWCCLLTSMVHIDGAVCSPQWCTSMVLFAHLNGKATSHYAHNKTYNKEISPCQGQLHCQEQWNSEQPPCSFAQPKGVQKQQERSVKQSVHDCSCDHQIYIYLLAFLSTFTDHALPE